MLQDVCSDLRSRFVALRPRVSLPAPLAPRSCWQLLDRRTAAGSGRPSAMQEPIVPRMLHLVCTFSMHTMRRSCSCLDTRRAQRRPSSFGHARSTSGPQINRPWHFISASGVTSLVHQPCRARRPTRSGFRRASRASRRQLICRYRREMSLAPATASSSVFETRPGPPPTKQVIG